MNPNYGKNKII